MVYSTFLIPELQSGYPNSSAAVAATMAFLTQPDALRRLELLPEEAGAFRVPEDCEPGNYDAFLACCAHDGISDALLAHCKDRSVHIIGVSFGKEELGKIAEVAHNVVFIDTVNKDSQWLTTEYLNCPPTWMSKVVAHVHGGAASETTYDVYRHNLPPECGARPAILDYVAPPTAWVRKQHKNASAVLSALFKKGAFDTVQSIKQLLATSQKELDAMVAAEEEPATAAY